MKIQSLEINNFKVFEQKFDDISEISDASLVLFNGPNGYGKTSVFDAIEFALTGSIKRIKDYCKNLQVLKTESYQKMILVSDESKEAWVKLKLVSKIDCIEILCKYTPNPTVNKKKLLKDYNPNIIFDKFKRSIRINDNLISEDTEIDEKLKHYQLNNLTTFFDKCCFLSQDEHLGFLKATGENKAKGLNFLFEMVEEQKEKERVTTLLDKIKNKNIKNNLGYLQMLDNEKEDLNKQIENINNSIININTDDEVIYTQLFPDKNYIWDSEILEMDQNTYTKNKELIDDFIYFAENQEICLEFINNKPYSDLMKPFSSLKEVEYDSNKLEYAFRYYPLVEKQEDIENKYGLQKKYQEIKLNIDNKNINKINFNFLLSEKLLIDTDLGKIEDSINQINNIEKRQNTISSVIENIEKSRNNLIKHMNTGIDNGYISDNVCVFCGNIFSKKEELQREIEKEQKVLQALCDDATKEKDTLVTKLYVDYLNTLAEKLDSKLQDSISEDTYKMLIKITAKKQNILEIQKLLEKLDVKLANEYVIDIDQMKIKYNTLLDEIKSKLKDIPSEVENELKKRDFVNKYEYYHDNNQEKLKKITSSMLKSKKKFIELQYFDFNIKNLNEAKRKLQITENRFNVLEKKYKELENYRDAIDKGIVVFKKKVLKDIEPLLYVYTAKILQQKFNGHSIILWYDEDMKQVRFVNSLQDTQDILYSMSSGQLAAVSIAFLLCMNQVYSKDRLPILMIDDPVQTIDDVNMVGLVDILRFEFADSQIFISTHEQKFEWFLRYKYEKTGKIIKPFNMKNLLLQVK